MQHVVFTTAKSSVELDPKAANGFTAVDGWLEVATEDPHFVFALPANEGAHAKVQRIRIQGVVR